MKFLRTFRQAYNGHVLIVTFVVGLFGVVLVGVQQSLRQAEQSIKDSLSVIVFLQSKTEEQEAQGVAASVKSQDPEVTVVEYTSKEQAYQEALNDPNLAKSLQLLKSNPLPASILVRYSDSAWWNRMDPAEKLRILPAVQEIRWDPQARSLFRSLHRWRLWIHRFSLFLGMVLLVWVFMGLYRYLALPGRADELSRHVIVGLVGGGLAWGLWTVGVRSVQTDGAWAQPVWAWLAPLLIGAIAAIGCYGLEVRRVD